MLASLSDDKRVVFGVSAHEASHVPYIWKVGNDGAWAPLQFFSGATELSERFERVKSSTDFLEAFSAKLTELKAENELGLQLVFDDMLGLDLEREVLFESTDVDARTQEMRVIPARDDFETNAWITTTMWRFNGGSDPKDPLKTMKCWCSGCCDDGAHGYHHGITI